MKRRDFICGLSCLLAGFCLGNFVDLKNKKNKINYNKQKERGIELCSIGIAISSHCNLNCKGCDVYAPLAKKEFVTYEQFVKDMNKLKKIAPDREYNTFFIGGEPLLNPELTKIINKTKELFPNAQKSILTNGILIEKMEENFFKAIKESNVSFGITKYPININFENIERILQKYGIEILYDPVKSDKIYDVNTKQALYNNPDNRNGFVWSQNILDLSGNQNWVEKRFTCPHRGIVTYARGNIYYCYIHAYINAFINYFKVNIPITKDDYIKIADVKSIEEIDDFLSKPKPLCRFCKQCHNTCYGDEPIEWNFSERKITEWT